MKKINRLLVYNNFHAPTLRGGHLDLPLSVCPSVCLSVLSVLSVCLSVNPKIFNFVTKVEKWGHPCSIDTFLVLFIFYSIFIALDVFLHQWKLESHHMTLTMSARLETKQNIQKLSILFLKFLIFLQSMGIKDITWP